MFKFTPKEKWLVILLGSLLVLGLALRFVLQDKDVFMARSADREGIIIADECGALEESGVAASVAEEKVIIVHITGAVVNAGVYTLEENSRVFHAVEKAGGALKDADLERINLAQPLYDGQPIYVPYLSDRSGSFDDGGQSPAGDPSGVKVNINTASKAQLETLPGIGNVKAQNIISYRQEHGPFQSIDDLTNVNGIGEKIFEGLKDFVTIY